MQRAIARYREIDSPYFFLVPSTSSRCVGTVYSPTLVAAPLRRASRKAGLGGRDLRLYEIEASHS